MGKPNYEMIEVECKECGTDFRVLPKHNTGFCYGPSCEEIYNLKKWQKDALPYITDLMEIYIFKNSNPAQIQHMQSLIKSAEGG